MKYIKIIADKDIYTKTKHLHLIKGELYTQGEFNRLQPTFDLIRSEDYTIVDIPKNKTGFLFGARIELNREGVK